MRILRKLVAGALAAGGAAAGACLAGDGITPPIPEPTFPWLAMFYTCVIVAGIAVVAFKNAKRTHLD